MCEICHRSPCHPRCPNAPDPPAVFICSGCGHEIYEGEEYWDILGEQYCTYCVDEAMTEAEHDTVCAVCDEVIYGGEDHYNMMGRPVCERCMEDARREARFVYDEDFYLDI